MRFAATRSHEMTLQSTSVPIVTALLLATPALSLENSGIPPGLAPQSGTNSLGAVDTATQLTLTGIVKFVHLGPARSRVQVLVTGSQRQVQEWSLEGPTQNVMAQLGNRRRPIAQWDQVSFSINPLIGVGAAGEIRALTSANGVNVNPP
jgi:hypothetical protein